MRKNSTVFAALLLASFLASALTAVPPVCWKIIGVDSYMVELEPTSCCTTPAGSGWTFANYAPLEHHFLSVRNDPYLNKGRFYYIGTDAFGVPILNWDYPLCCPSTGFSEGISPLGAGSCIDRLPLRDLIVKTADGVFGTSRDTNNFVRKYWASTWQTDFIAHDPPDIVPGSLVEDTLLSAWGMVYGVNFFGQVVLLWNDGTSLSSAVLTTTSGVDPFSLAPGNGHFLFGVTTGGALFHLDVTGQMVTVAHSGAPPVPESLVASGASSIFGVNTAGQIFGTLDFKGQVLYYLLPNTADVHPESLVVNDNGLFYITNSGDLYRAWWDGTALQVGQIPHWGGALEPSSLIRGQGIGDDADVYGVNAFGELFLTWNNNGVLTFALISVGADADPDSLVLSGGSSVFGVTNAGALFRTYWNTYSSIFQMDILPHWGGALVPTSLIAGGGIGPDANIYGVNEHGDFFTTWNDSGTIRFALIP